ncbi:hypothetical protein HA402_011234 [Bradysia odoriphaga]|nr:hypothetical protein HA402_011234 [Bradysia odoriphaga]
MDIDGNEDIAKKLERVLNGFLVQGCKLIDDVYLEMLITHLSRKTGEHCVDVFKQSAFFREWIGRAATQIESNSQNSAQLCAFTLRLMAILFTDEWLFMNIIETDICLRLKNTIYDHAELRTPSVKLAHVLLLKAILRHSFGTVWIKNHESWKLIIEYCMENQTIYVVRESQEFLNDFLFKVASVLHNDALCIEIITAITAPLTKSVVIENANVCVDGDDLQRTVRPTLDLICHILDFLIKSDVKTCIAHHISVTCNVKTNCWRLTDMTKNEMFFKKIMHTQAHLAFAQLTDKLVENAATSVDYNVFGLHFFNIMNFCILFKSAYSVLSTAKLYHVLWIALGKRVPEEIQLENHKIKFENQIIVLQLLPILSVIQKKILLTELFDAYIMKLFDISTEHTMRVCYSFRELLLRNKTMVPEVAAKSIQGILLMTKHLHRDRAVYVFQALTYTLKDFSVEPLTDDKIDMSADKLIDMPNLLSAILTGLYEMIKKYRITWKESLESVCILNFMISMLNKTNLPSRLAVQALKLTQLSIEHFLAPNLALLVEDLQGSGMERLGPTVVKRLHDINWEVRDSTLELLTAMSTIAIFKFPAFQQHIAESDICPIVVTLAKNDSESYVRASALSCLCPMVSIQMFWESSLSSSDLMTHLLTVLQTEPEGIVRKEAVCLVTSIYEHHNINAQQSDMLFSTLAYCAVSDLHWEVKTSVLAFWKIVITRQFHQHGVVDGGFPAVIFSKQHKKIITLTQKEILSRLDNVLGELSALGCLGILLECLTDDCDLEVLRIAIAIIKDMMAFLNKYNYLESNTLSETVTTENGPATSVNCIVESETGECIAEPYLDSDSVIESIISANDINLLATAYENQLNFNGENVALIDEQYFKQFNKVTALDFIRRISAVDLDGLHERRLKWIEKNDSFSSLLDDISFSLKIDNLSSADCY